MPSIIPLQGRDFCDRVLLEFLNLTGEPYEYRSIRGSVPGFDGEMLVIRLLCHMNRGRGHHLAN